MESDILENLKSSIDETTGKYSYISESTIVPLNFNKRSGITANPETVKGGVFDPGAAMAQAFAQGLGNKPPKIEIPEPKMSKSDQYVRDLMNFTCPVPSAGNTIKDERPETHDELIAKYHPVQINEVPPSKNVEFEYTGMNGMFISDAPITEIPYNGFPNIMI